MDTGDIIISKNLFRDDDFGKDICILLDKIKIDHGYFYHMYNLIDAEYEMLEAWSLDKYWELLA